MWLKGAGPGLHEGRGGLYTYICGMNRFLAVMWGKWPEFESRVDRRGS